MSSSFRPPMNPCQLTLDRAYMFWFLPRLGKPVHNHAMLLLQCSVSSLFTHPRDTYLLGHATFCSCSISHVSMCSAANRVAHPAAPVALQLRCSVLAVTVLKVETRKQSGIYDNCGEVGNAWHMGQIDAIRKAFERGRVQHGNGYSALIVVPVQYSRP